LFPEMGDDVRKAHKDERGYTCPVCGREGLTGSEMVSAWSAADWSYVACWCMDCQERMSRRYHQAIVTEAEPSAA
jgi:hypothetical protein